MPKESSEKDPKGNTAHRTLSAAQAEHGVSRSSSKTPPAWSRGHRRAHSTGSRKRRTRSALGQSRSPRGDRSGQREAKEEAEEAEATLREKAVRMVEEGVVKLAYKEAAAVGMRVADTDDGAEDVPDSLKEDGGVDSQSEYEDDDDVFMEPDLESFDTDLQLSQYCLNRQATLEDIKRAVEDKVRGLKSSKDVDIDKDPLLQEDREAAQEQLEQLLSQLSQVSREAIINADGALDVLKGFLALRSGKYALMEAMQLHLDDMHAQTVEGLLVRLSRYETDAAAHLERTRFAAASGFQPLVIDDIGMEMSFSAPTTVYYMSMAKLRKKLSEGSRVSQFFKSKDRPRQRREVVLWVAASSPQLCVAPLVVNAKSNSLMPSSTVKTVPLGHVMEIRLGQKTQPFERRAKKHSYAHDNYELSFSLILMSGKTLDFVASSTDEFQLWVHGLIRLILIVQLEGPSLVPLQRAWRRARKTSAVTYGELLFVLHTMNIHKSKAKEILKLHDFEKTGTYTFSQVTEKLADTMFRRPGVNAIFKEFAAGPQMTAKEFSNFLLWHQKEEYGDGYVASIMRQISGDTTFTREQFETYLESRFNTAWDPKCSREIYHDMRQPLLNYYLNSSHNTYCAEDQLLGVSTNDMYRRVLLQGCRCVELDTWDGSDGEPVIYHGHTMTTKILVQDVCRAIMSYAFVTSPYPVVLSVENHCGMEQQARMAEIFVEVFGASLEAHAQAEEGTFVCPSPEDLRYKILVKGKFACPAMAELVFMHSTSISKAKELVEAGDVRYPQVSSLTENAIVKASEQKMIRISKSVFVRTYPAGDRINSTNYNPDKAWACGCQMVALNMQTSDLHTWRNTAKFTDNGGCGMLLKPTVMWSRDVLDVLGMPVEVEVTIHSARNLPKRASHGDHVVSPYVKLVVTGAKKDHLSKRTKLVKNSGLCPEWQKTFTFDVTSPDLAVLTFVVYDGHAASGKAGFKPTKKGTAGATVATGGVLAAGAVVATGGLALPIVLGGAAAGALGAAVVGYSVANKSRHAKLAYASIPLNCLRTGYRILPLSNKKNCVDTLCDLLIHTKITPKRDNS